ncbi:GTP pyrophosphokinase [Nocardioides nematodiphilus]|uniref:GTP pyrophosphokinase n=1 Tax=Nocardioides nematodiphilus TaxID=2849669 RepID=UPI001CDA49BC|nr:GTP pyrophosphokinase family protein [Nocardioides nematodiphilus]MCA1981475.1 GTP pyrophosphokinase family protein [Nocardioides nematodiphilus]
MTDLEQDGPPELGTISQLVAAAELDPHSVALSEAAQEISQLLMPYRFALEEMLTKINIIREELSFRPDGSPIEHVSSRLKSIDSIRMKAGRIGCEVTSDAIGHQIFDIAGIRIVCSFLEDTYWVLSMLTSQPDVKVVEIKDYIANPKPNGYRSLHAIVQIPVFLSDSIREVCVELQVRTVAMDFWASVEHKIYYKFREEIPSALGDELAEAASVAHELDQRMSDLRESLRGSAAPAATGDQDEGDQDGDEPSAQSI